MLVLFSFVSLAQRQDAHGSLNIRNYASTEYNGQTQIFSITQDKRGVMYFGNKAGVIEYDGTTWRTIEVLNENGESREVNCLATDKNGRVYVAAKGDFGYLRCDEKGQLQFFSLLPKVKGVPDLKTPRSIQATNHGIFYHYGKDVYQFANNKVSFWESDANDEIYGVFYADGKIYMAKSKTGLYYIDGNYLQAAINGAKYIDRYKIYAITNFTNGTYIQTSDGQIDNYSDPNNIQAVSLAYTRPAYNAINVFDQYYSSGSFSDGLLIYDRNFSLSYQIDLSNGLIDGNVNSQFLDREGNIWIGTNKGISKIDVISPISRFGVNFGMISGVEGICNFKGKTYFATLSGVYFLNDKYQNSIDRISKVAGLNIDCFGIKTMVFGGTEVLLVAANNGVYMLRDHNGTLKQVAKCGPYNFIQSPLDRNEILIANYDGLSKIRWTGSGFRDEGYVKGFSEDIFNINAQQDGTLWLGTIANGVIKSHVNPDPKTGKYKKLQIGSEKDGPAYVALVDGVPHVGNDNGLFVIVNNKLVKSDVYKLPKKCGVHRLMKDSNGRLWAVLVFEDNKYEIGYFQNDATHKWNPKDFQRFSDDIIHGLYSDSKNRTWLGGPNGLMLFNPEIKKNYSPGFNTLIRSVSIGDSAIFNGCFIGKDYKPLLWQSKNAPELLYSSKSLNFEYSATTFFDEEGTTYSYKLEGQDDDWSAWSYKTEKSYTNLHEGEYTFLVKAKNIYGYISPITKFHFTISPPWYRRIWAFILYGVAFILFLYVALKLGNRRIRLQKEHLEKIVKIRTAEVVEQKAEIEKQKDLVDEKNKDIMDSIRYAKRLQDAILPTDEYIHSCFGNSFVFFQPKDIVSGDFYWFRKIRSKIYFAAVDCTGHGVPGAFVSIVGNNGLNRAIREFELKKPSEILDKLSLIVEEAFISEGNIEVKDGMDIALCCYDTKTQKLEFAGANNPLYLIIDGELIETKGNKQPVGPYAHRVPFTNHEFQLKKGDSIFLFTDGYADQFGGPSGKKFKYSRFKDLLLESSDTHFSETGVVLKKEFDDWKEGHEQIDDVCVLGVKIS